MHKKFRKSIHTIFIHFFHFELITNQQNVRSQVINHSEDKHEMCT